ncbi:MAG TPA: carboxypeptidase-like regulatory domain-containing protein [Chloroflexota bacterium]|nr:carboxypeptidase-like regulatory domain-containing protein [Chloroflexota bacterium]
MASSSGVTLSGRVLDPSGNGIPNQTVGLAPAGSSDWTTTTTSSTGAYSFQVAPGNYSVQVNAYNNSPSINAPQSYYIDPDPSSPSSLALSQNTTMDISLPVKRVSVHVQDSNGNPQSGVVLSVGGVYSPNLPIGTLTGYGYSGYSKTATAPLTTNAAGDASLWLFPTPGAPNNTPYAITATPPAWSPYVAASITNVSVVADTAETITIPFVHDPPVTAASTSPAPDAQGQYSGPVTVTLSRSVYSGFTANTYYRVDQGSQQTYSAPFTVSGTGTHSVQYWSVDNAGVYETAKLQVINIVAPTGTPTSTSTVTATPSSTASPSPSATSAAAATATGSPTRTRTAAPTTSPTPTSTVAPGTCAPRPNVGVTVAPDGTGRLQVTITANTSAGTPQNELYLLRFGSPTGGVIEVPGSEPNAIGGFTLNLPPGARQTSFFTRPSAAGQSATVPLTVVDTCGSWPTFVGAGPNGLR